MQIHPVFHIGLLRPAPPDAADQFPERIQIPPPLPPVKVQNNQAFYVVESIVGHFRRSATCHLQAKSYTIKWICYPSWENSTEPAKVIYRDVPHFVHRYWAERAASMRARRR